LVHRGLHGALEQRLAAAHPPAGLPPGGPAVGPGDGGPGRARGRDPASG
jgi:hypothetical protein